MADPYEVAERCKVVVETWRRKRIDVSRDGLELLSDFSRALGLRMDVAIVPDRAPESGAGHPGRGTAVYDATVGLLNRSTLADWTAPEVLAELHAGGIPAEPKQIHNVLGYLAKEGRLTRVERGRYRVANVEPPR